jgi:hypothetical protein
MRYTICGLLVPLIMVLVPPFVWADGSQTQTPAEPGKVLAGQPCPCGALPFEGLRSLGKERHLRRPVMRLKLQRRILRGP